MNREDRMQTFQELILEILEATVWNKNEAREVTMVPIQEPTASNAGTIYVMWEDTFSTLAYFSYHFQPGHNTVRFNGAALGTELAFLFKATDSDKMENMWATWHEVLDAAIDAGLKA